MPEVATVSQVPQRRALEIPFESYKRNQASIARRKMFPLTAFYTAYAALLFIFAASSGRPWTAVAFFAAGWVTWTLVEYLFHRYVLHGRFPPGQGFIRKFLHERLDPLHWDHHMRPLDGNHISGQLNDILPLFFVAAPVSFLFPVYSAPMLLAGVVQSYVSEEWLHYALHFSNSRFPPFRRLKKYHLYHHSPRGIDKGYGITTRFWDGVFDTRFPQDVRRSLSKN
ncbi:MAG: sterol desaturase family protein [Candidatus Acidiferrum sp.]|jgi:sterol desaturase/sphingolipid hydroxylase (fatty acid hydroxylase superfamily)